MGERPSGPTGWLRGLFRGGSEKKPLEFPGEPIRTSGAAAVVATEARVAEAICRLRITGGLASTNHSPALPADAVNAFGRLLATPDAKRPCEALAGAGGLAFAGLRTAVFLRDEELGKVHGALRSAARRRLPLIAHATFPSAAPTARGHGDYHALADTGAFLTLARNAQEAVDLTLVARVVAELALVPGIVALDDDGAEQDLLLPEPELIRRFLGDPNAEIASPTPAQILLFGENRRRVPRWFDVDRPVAHGLPPQGSELVAALAGQQLFFTEPVGEIAEEAMATLSAATGRTLGFVHSDGLDGAEYAIVARGAAVGLAAAVADELRSDAGVKIGVLGLTWLRPFPADEIREALTGVKGVTVLEAADDALAEGPPLQQKIRAILPADGPRSPRLTSAIYRAPLRRAEIAAICRNMQQGDEARPKVWLGVAPPAAEVAGPPGYPRREALVHRLRREYPELERSTLAVETPAATPAANVAEPELPMAVRRFAKTGTTYDNVARFWGELVQPRLATGGSPQPTVPDPYLALGAVPSSTATFHDMTAGRERIPRINAAACSGCGKCWTACPDSALAAVAAGTAALLDAAADRVAARAAADPHPVVAKLRRAHRQLAARIDGQLAKSGARAVTAELVEEAGAWLFEKMQLEAADEEPFREAIAAIAAEIGALPFAVNDAFFHQPHAANKGSGELVLLAVNSQACQGCGVCAEVCPEDAVAIDPQTGEAVDALRAVWRAWEDLPDTPGPTIARVGELDEVGYLPAILMSRHCLFSLAGGDGAEPGSGERLAVRQVAAIVEYHMQRRLLSHGQALEKLAQNLREGVRGTMVRAVPVEDLEALDAALEGPPRQSGNLPAVLARMEELDKHPAIDALAVRRLIRSSREIERLRQEITEGPHGNGRARFAVVVTGAVTEWAARFARNPWTVPVAVDLDGHGAGLALGLLRGLLDARMAEARSIRRAELRLEAPADLPAREKALDALTRDELTPQEQELMTPLLVVGDRESLASTGLAGLSRLLSSELPVKVVLLDGRDLPLAEADPVLIALAHRRAFLVATSVAHPQHLYDGVAAALEYPGPALIHIHTPSPGRHGFATEATVERARLAVDCRVQPLVCYDPRREGVFGSRLDLAGNPAPEASWAKDDEGTELTPATWASGEERFAARLEGEGLASAVAERRENWGTFQELAGLVTPFTAQVRATVEREHREAHEAELAALRRDYEAKLAELDAQQQAAQAARLRDRLLQLVEVGREKQGRGEIAEGGPQP